jgi:HlyD family secretion protein
MGMDRDLDAATRHRRRLRKLVVAAPWLAVGLALVFGLPRWLAPSLDRDLVRTARVDRGPVEATLVASGTVVPAFETVVSTPVDARVVRVLKRPGDPVAAGEEVLDLDFSAARLDLGRLEDRLAQKASERARLAEESARELADLGGAVETARLDVETARYRLEQRRRLSSDGLASDAVLREAEVEARKAEIELARLVESAAAARRVAASRDAEVGLDQRLLGRERDEAAHRLELASTRAARAGVVTWVIPQEGVTVRAGEPVARLADLTAFRVEATLSDAYAARLTPGLPARVLLDGQELDGTLAQVYPEVEDGAVRFTVDLDRRDHPALRPALRVDVLLVTDRRPDALRVARGPFAGAGGAQSVLVVEGDRAVRRPVAIGLIGYREVEVLSGLAQGDEVIVSDTGDYAHLDSVRLKGTTR